MRSTRKLLALLLCVVMVLSLAAPASAAGETNPVAARNILGVETGAWKVLPQTAKTVYAPEQTVRAIVLLEGEPTAKANPMARTALQAGLTARHAGLRASLRQAGIPYTEDYDYTTLLNGMAVTAAFEDLERIADLPGVVSVHIVNHYDPPEVEQVSAANEMVGMTYARTKNLKGTGMVIAVLDTGITPEHEAFQVYKGTLKSPKLAKADVKTQISALGYGKYLSKKIPFAYDYADQDNDATDNDSGHGTHVSGIAAGYAVGEDGGVAFEGTAPDAQILTMKIFSDEIDQPGTDSAIYFKALEDAYKLGADVINMSLGGQNGFTYDYELEDEVFGDIYQTLYNNGVAVVVAAGNEGSMADGSSNWAGPGTVTSDYADYGVVASPATYGKNFAVASVENATYPMNFIQAGSREILLYEADGDYFYQTLRMTEEESGEPIEYVVVPGYGRPEDYEGLMMDGRVALVSRGKNTFQEKVEAANDAGALALLVYNNEAGPLYMSIDYSPIPAAAISQADGKYLKSHVRTVDPNEGIAVDSDENLLGPYAPISSLDELEEGNYLIVNQGYGLILDPDADQSNPGNTMEAFFTSRGIEATEEVQKASFHYSSGAMLHNGRYLTRQNGGHGVYLSESPENLEIAVDSADEVTIRVDGETLRFDQDWEGFRFAPADQAPEEWSEWISLYRQGPAIPYDLMKVGDFTAMTEPKRVENENAWRMSSFSSWGVTPDLKLKPVISGVGGMVSSAAAHTEDGYVTFSGTSMATPNVSGAMACMLQFLAKNQPKVTGKNRVALAEALLESTANLLVNEDGTVYSPRKQGAGLIDVEKAIQARAYITEPVLSLLDSKTGAFTVSFTVKNLVKEALTYEVALEGLTDQVYDATKEGGSIYNLLTPEEVTSGLTVTGKTTVSVPAGGSAKVSLTVKVSSSLLKKLNKRFPNGCFLDGVVGLTETFTPCGGVNCPGAKFTDMPAVGHWAHNGIDFAVRNGLFKGTSATTFEPETPMNRAMMVTVLYRMAGSPKVSGTNPFTDVPASEYFTNPVIWAAKNKIVKGTTSTTFEPYRAINREELTTILYRYAKFAKLDLSKKADLSRFPDEKQVDSWAKEAMSWAVGTGIVNGDKDAQGRTILNPYGLATRAQVATMFYRFSQKLLGGDPILDADLHAVFTGFVGDWTAAPIMESHDWREIIDVLMENSDALEDENTSILDLVDFEVNIGLNMVHALNKTLFTEFNMPFGGYLGVGGDVPFRDYRSAISRKGMTDCVYIVPVLLRNARHLIMVVTDRNTGEVYYVDDSEYVPKSVWDAENGQWIPTATFLYSGEDSDNNLLPDGTELQISFYANLAYGKDTLGKIPYEDLPAKGGSFLTWSFPLTLDDTAPVLSDLVYDPAAKTLRLTASDTQYLAYVGMADLNAAPAEEGAGLEPMYLEYMEDTAPGQTHSVTVTGVEPGDYIVAAEDYAGNSCQIYLSLGDTATLYPVRFISAEGVYNTGAPLYLASKGREISIPGAVPNGTNLEIKGWLPEPLEDEVSWSYLEESGLAEEILRQGDTYVVNGPATFYTLMGRTTEWYSEEERLMEYNKRVEDFTGTWAIGANGEDNGYRFLNSDLETVTIDAFQEEGSTYIDVPDSSVLFEFEMLFSIYGSIFNVEKEQYLTVEQGALAYTDVQEDATWMIDYDEETGNTNLIFVGNGDYYALVYDYDLNAFTLVPSDEVDPGAQWSSIFGRAPKTMLYSTAQE